MKKLAKKIKFLRIIILSIVALTATFTLLPDYLQKAVIYYKPNIDDHKIFNNREVTAGNPIPWPKSKKYNAYEVSQAWKDTLKHYETVSFLVVHKDSLLYENYMDNHTDSTYSNPFSVTKSIVSLLIGCAIEDGYISDLDEKVTNYLSWLKGGYSQDLTIRHLLSMSSSSTWDESYSSPFSITARAYYGRNLRKTIRDLEIKKQPGIVFRYKSGDTQLLGAILKEATGQNISEYASRKLWQPLGAEIPAKWSLDKKDGTEKAFCCFNTTARDLARIGSLILNEGKFNGQQIVPSQYIKETKTPVRYLTDEDAKMVDYYGLHWWLIKQNNHHIPYARGIFGQYIFVIPEHDAIIVRLGHRRSHQYRNNHPKDVYSWLKVGLEILENAQ